MFDFIERHPYLTAAFILPSFANLLVAVFLPLEVISALAITATAFLTYGLILLLVKAVVWAFSEEEVVAREPVVPRDPYEYEDNYRILNLNGTYSVPSAPSAAVADSDVEDSAPQETKTTAYEPEDDELAPLQQPEIELNAEELEYFNDVLNPLLDALTEDSLALDTYKLPIIASDLFMYDNTPLSHDNTPLSYESLISRNMVSPNTRAPFLRAPFPFSYVNLQTLCSALGEPGERITSENLQKLLNLAVCPVTKEIMKNPKIARINSRGTWDSRYDFVLVCDQSALDSLPATFRLIGRRDFAALKNITQEPMVGPKLEAALAAAPVRREEDMECAWKAAYIQAQTDFPSTVAPAAPSYSYGIGSSGLGLYSRAAATAGWRASPADSYRPTSR